jgi:hypothetical protein
MSVSEELLCAFELLRPLDGQALRKEMTKAKRKRSVSFSALTHSLADTLFSAWVHPLLPVPNERVVYDF